MIQRGAKRKKGRNKNEKAKKDTRRKRIQKKKAKKKKKNLTLQSQPYGRKWGEKGNNRGAKRQSPQPNTPVPAIAAMMSIPVVCIRWLYSQKRDFVHKGLRVECVW